MCRRAKRLWSRAEPDDPGEPAAQVYIYTASAEGSREQDQIIMHGPASQKQSLYVVFTAYNILICRNHTYNNVNFRKQVRPLTTVLGVAEKRSYIILIQRLTTK